jgi:hypothetical protein
MRPAEGDDAIGLLTAAEALRHQVGRIYRLSFADQAAPAVDPLSLRRRGLGSTRAERVAAGDRLLSKWADGELRRTPTNLAPAPASRAA